MPRHGSNGSVVCGGTLRFGLISPPRLLEAQQTSAVALPGESQFPTSGDTALESITFLEILIMEPHTEPPGRPFTLEDDLTVYLVWAH